MIIIIITKYLHDSNFMHFEYKRRDLMGCALNHKLSKQLWTIWPPLVRKHLSTAGLQ